jgi:hypothetical protein
MRTPFDTNDVAWWAVHGASMPGPPSDKVMIDPIEALADELLATSPRSLDDEATRMEEAARRDGLSLREFIEATERDTVKDLSLLRATPVVDEPS